MLELWYRFVWARHTHIIHEKIRKRDQLKAESEKSAADSKPIDVEGTIRNHFILSLMYRLDEDKGEQDSIIDLNDLGAGQEDENEEEDEESDGEGEHDVRVIISKSKFELFLLFG